MKVKNEANKGLEIITHTNTRFIVVYFSFERKKLQKSHGSLTNWLARDFLLVDLPTIVIFTNSRVTRHTISTKEKEDVVFICIFFSTWRPYSYWLDE